ncbi:MULTISPECIES: hypothetical protein [unclassified Butyrivibrio]|nr:MULTISPECIES: hypothetical protein [unclassified Butyrivibrio]
MIETYAYDYDEMAYEDDSILEMTRGITSDELCSYYFGGIGV